MARLMMMMIDRFRGIVRHIGLMEPHSRLAQSGDHREGWSLIAEGFLVQVLAQTIESVVVCWPSEISCPGRGGRVDEARLRLVGAQDRSIDVLGMGMGIGLIVVGRWMGLEM